MARSGMAAERIAAVMRGAALTANAAAFDALLQLRPTGRVLLYRPVPARRTS